MGMTKFRIIGVIVLGVILLSGGYFSPASFSQEVSESKASCVDTLDYVFAHHNLEKPSHNTKEWRSQFTFCDERVSGTAPEILKKVFDLDENSSPEKYKRVAKILKSHAIPSNGRTQVYVPGFGNVGASVQSVRTGGVDMKDPVAQYIYGYIYANGLTGKVKIKRAKRFLGWAVQQGYAPAKELLDEIENGEQ